MNETTQVLAPTDTEETTVIFRRFRSGNKEVIALFPYDIQTQDYSCGSYMHVGQHGAANYQALLSTTRLANPEDADVKALKKELESYPYNYRFNVVKRAQYDKIREAINEFWAARRRVENNNKGS